MNQVHIYIIGFVQGVGYRDFVKNKARKYGVVGWVKNLPARNASQSLASAAGRPDGRPAFAESFGEVKVEVVAQGEKEDLEKLIADCKRGSFLAEVEDVIIKWEDIQESYKDFIILR